MTHTPVLTLLDFEKPFDVSTDVSEDGIGIVMVQAKSPLRFVSKTLGPMKKAWRTCVRELLIVMHAI